MWVTCYTDASFDGHTGAWAVWIRSSRGRIVRSGACPPYVKDSNAAELAAIFAGIHLALREWPGKVRGILICSDSQVALSLASPEASLVTSEKNPSFRRLQLKIRTALADAQVELQTRWVKGHRSPKSGTTAYLNHQCDRFAYQHRTTLPGSQPASNRPRHRSGSARSRRAHPSTMRRNPSR
jgi:ribonuclease HI